LLLTGNRNQGIAELRAAVKIDDSIADGHFQLGRALMQAGEKQEGNRELNRARELHEAKRKAESERFKPKAK